eukprot:3935581-Rhodomonas_salina.5
MEQHAVALSALTRALARARRETCGKNRMKKSAWQCKTHLRQRRRALRPDLASACVCVCVRDHGGSVVRHSRSGLWFGSCLIPESPPVALTDLRLNLEPLLKPHLFVVS